MAKQTPKKGGGKLNRSQTVTLRLDPRLKYLTDIAGRTQHRTTSSFIEWAIEKSLSQIELYSDQNNHVSLADEANNLWDIEECDRVVKLGLNYPHILSLEEQAIWKVITTNLFFWRYLNRTDDSRPEVSERSLVLQSVRENWETIKAVAEGNADRADLPSARDRQKSASRKSSAPIDDGFDDIPF